MVPQPIRLPPVVRITCSAVNVRLAVTSWNRTALHPGVVLVCRAAAAPFGRAGGVERPTPVVAGKILPVSCRVSCEALRLQTTGSALAVRAGSRRNEPALGAERFDDSPPIGGVGQVAASSARHDLRPRGGSSPTATCVAALGRESPPSPRGSAPTTTTFQSAMNRPNSTCASGP